MSPLFRPAGPSFVSWDTLPDKAQHLLMTASSGKEYLAQAAQAILEAASSSKDAPGLISLGLDLFAASFEADPLHAPSASMLISIIEQLPRVPRDQLPMLQAITRAWKTPDDTRYVTSLAQRQKYERLQKYCERQADQDKGNLYWTYLLRALYRLAGDYGAERELLSSLPDTLAPVRTRMLADTYFLAGDMQLAEQHYAESLACSLWVQTRFRLGETLLRQGRKDEAVLEFHQALTDFPWHVSGTCRLHDVLAGLDSATQSPDGPVAILLSTYNKRDGCEATLKALSQADLSNCRVVVLNNGSTDGTAEVLKHVAPFFPDDTFRHFNLPINIGAPAARNWLMKAPEVTESSYVVYLDDDAPPPKDFIQRLYAAVQAYPEAGVWGCRVVDHAMPERLQSVDLHLVPPQNLPVFELSSAHLAELDFGQYNHVRPCASVAGCCQMFRTDALLSGNGFDIRFSPSRYDDLDHDIQLGKAGSFAVCQGHLALPRMKNTGKLMGEKSLKQGHSSNRSKLETKYDQGVFDAIMQDDLHRSIEDVTRKNALIQETLSASTSAAT